MKVVGIVAEYHPFHAGHLYQITYARETLGANFVVAAMSGDFVQRGTPACLPKHLRAEMALRCGVDLVVEMPVQSSSASAEFFARGGVSLLDGFGVVNQLCFGSESGDIEQMMTAAKILNDEPEGFQKALKTHLKNGMSFPAARNRALIEYAANSVSRSQQDRFSDQNSNSHFAPGFPKSDMSGQSNLQQTAKRQNRVFSALDIPKPDATGQNIFRQTANCPHAVSTENLLSSPNNILGVEYCRAILDMGSSMEPVTLKRQGADYHSRELDAKQMPSASAIRDFLQQVVAFSDACGCSQRTSNFSAVHDILQRAQDTATIHGFSRPEDQNNIIEATILNELKTAIPAPALSLLANAFASGEFLTEADLDIPLQYCLWNENADTLVQYADMSPELAARIMNRRRDFQSFTQFSELLKTKELTRARIQRALLHTFLHITETPRELPYARVLGFRKSAAPLPREIKKRGRIPLLTKLADAEALLSPEASRILDVNTRASNIYESLLCRKSGKSFRHEYEKPLIIL